MYRIATSLCAALLGVAFAAPALAAYPDRPIKLVVPYTPGGSTDQFGRAMAEGMSRELKQAVVVENRPGANTMVGTQGVARAQPDGYTILMGSSASMVLNPMLCKKTGYDPKDFKVILIGIEVPLVVVTNNQVPASNIKDFAAYAKAAGGKLTDIVQLSVFLTDMRYQPQFAKIAQELFKGGYPAITYVEVSHMAEPQLLIEIQPIAVIP